MPLSHLGREHLRRARRIAQHSLSDTIAIDCQAQRLAGFKVENFSVDFEHQDPRD